MGDSINYIKYCGLQRCINTVDLKKCASCGSIEYCSKEHQIEHFKDGGHKMVCPGRTKSPPLTFNDCLQKASKYYSQQMWVAALPYYCAMLELTERQVGLLHPQNANLLDVIATCYRNQEKIRYAIECLQKCIPIREYENDGSLEKNQASINLLGRIAEYYILDGQLELAKTFLSKTEEQIITLFGEQSFQRGKILNSLAVCLEKLGDLDGAEKVLTVAISLDSFNNCSHVDDLLIVSNVFFNFGLLLMKRDRPKDAIIAFNRSLQLRENANLPSDNEDMIALQAQITLAEEKANKQNL
jgi:tetratricopeptide (TPR) repeat protein